MATKRRHPEFELQCAVARHLELALDPTQCRYTHIPNQGTADARRGAMLKAMGLHPGAPDFWFWPDNGKGFGIEMKADKGKLNPAQKEFHEWGNANDHPCFEARSIEEVEQILISHEIPLKARVQI